MATPLVTAAELSDWGATQADAQLELAAEAVTLAFERYCNREFARVQCVETPSLATHRPLELRTGWGGWELRTRRIPIVSVQAIKIDGTAITDYSVRDANLGILHRASGWPRSVMLAPDLTADPLWDLALENISIAYEAGWSEGTAPADLKIACIQECLRMLSRPVNGWISEETTPGGWRKKYGSVAKSTNPGSAFLPDTLAVLDGYVLREP